MPFFTHNRFDIEFHQKHGIPFDVDNGQYTFYSERIFPEGSPEEAKFYKQYQEEKREEICRIEVLARAAATLQGTSYFEELTKLLHEGELV